MDLDQLESKLKQISSSTPSTSSAAPTSSSTETRPVSVTRKVKLFFVEYFNIKINI